MAEEITIIETPGEVLVILESAPASGASGGLQTIGMSNLGNTGGITGILSGGNIQYLFAGGNNITLSQSINGSSGTLSIMGGPGGGGGGALSLSAGGSSVALASLLLSDSNGISFGLSGSTITASHNGLTNSALFRATSDNSQIQFTSNNSNFLGTVATQSFRHTSADSQLRFTSADSQLQFTSANSNFLGTGATQSFRHTSADTQLRFTSADSQLRFTSADSQLRFTSADTQLQFTSQFQSLGMSNLGNTSGTTGMASGSTPQVVFVGGNNITLSQSLNGSLGTITISGANAIAQTVESQSFGASNLGNTVGTSGIASGGQIRFLLAGGNNITLSQSINGASGTITISAPNQSTQVLSVFAVSNTTQSSSGSIDARSLSFQGAGVASVGVSNGSVVISVPSGGGAAGTNTLGMSNIGNTSGDTSIRSGSAIQLVFAGGNNVTLSQSTAGSSATITISAFNQSVQPIGTNTIGMSNIGNTSGDTAIRSGTGMQVVFAGGNNITLSQSTAGSNATITISAANSIAQTVESQTLGMSNLGNTSGTTGVASGGQVRFLFAGGNNVTLSQSINGASGTITIVGPNTAAQSNQNLSLFALGNTTQNSSTLLNASNLSFNGIGGISVGYSGGSIQLSGPQTVAQTNQTMGYFATGNTTQSSSGTQDARSVTFQGAGNVSVGISGGSVVISGASAAPSPVNFSAGANSGNLGSVVFSNSNLVSFGLNGSTITGSVPGTSSLSATGIVSIAVNASTISIGAKFPDLQYFEIDDAQGFGLATHLSAINTRPIFVPFVLKGNLTNSSLILQLSRATSGSNLFTVQAGIYTMANATSANLLASLSNNFSASNTGSMSGNVYMALNGWGTAATALTPGQYLLGLNFSAGATASMNYSLYGGQTGSAPIAIMSSGSDQNNTNNTTWAPINGWGRYTANSAALPANLAQSHLIGGFSGASQPLTPWFVLRS